MYNEITEMQAEWNQKWRDKKRWIIVEEDEGYSIHEHTKDGVAPPTLETDKRSMASRFLQLLQIAAVRPQTYSEEICVGEFSIRGSESRESASNTLVLNPKPAITAKEIISDGWIEWNYKSDNNPEHDDSRIQAEWMGGGINELPLVAYSMKWKNVKRYRIISEPEEKKEPKNNLTGVCGQ